MSEIISTQCCIAGGGPAGMMLGYLLARAGVDVVVLEKHNDFLRDFRGDTVHPSTLELMHEAGLLQQFLERPHQELRELAVEIGNQTITIGDFTHLPTRCKFVALMPQWDFLDFLAGRARRYRGFHLRMQAEVTELTWEGERVAGAQVRASGEEFEVRAPLTVGADGRHSTVRKCAGLEILNLGAPMDVVWMRLSRKPGDPQPTFGRVDAGKLLVMLNRETYWQCAFVIPKGGFERLLEQGLPAFREQIAAFSPLLRDRMNELRDWNSVSLLTVTVDRLKQWFLPGLLCIGDAAHAMSPIGGVGINLAIQDAVATANRLAGKLARGTVTEDDLGAVQARRMFPTRATQRLQIVAQDRIIKRVLGARQPVTLPWPIKLLRRWPRLRRILPRIVGLGFRPEHIRTPETRIA